MPTQEDRLDRLEMKVASLELERLYEQRMAVESTPSEQALNLKDVNHNTTMLLGIASGQERAIKAIQADVDSIKNRVEQIDANVISLDVKVDKRFVALEGRMTALEQRFVTLEGKIEQRFTTLESKVDQIFQILTRLSDR